MPKASRRHLRGNLRDHLQESSSPKRRYYTICVILQPIKIRPGQDFQRKIPPPCPTPSHRYRATDGYEEIYSVSHSGCALVTKKGWKYIGLHSALQMYSKEYTARDSGGFILPSLLTMLVKSNLNSNSDCKQPEQIFLYHTSQRGEGV